MKSSEIMNLQNFFRRIKMNYNKSNMEIYEVYLDSNKARNFETMNITYKMYRSRMIDYLSYLKEHEGNKLLLSEATIKNCVSILKRYINNCKHNIFG